MLGTVLVAEKPNVIKLEHLPLKIYGSLKDTERKKREARSRKLM